MLLEKLAGGAAIRHDVAAVRRRPGGVSVLGRADGAPSPAVTHVGAVAGRRAARCEV